MQDCKHNCTHKVYLTTSVANTKYAPNCHLLQSLTDFLLQDYSPFKCKVKCWGTTWGSVTEAGYISGQEMNHYDDLSQLTLWCKKEVGLQMVF